MPENLPARVAEKKALNGDTVGWLFIPGTPIDDVVVHYPGDFNEYYLRRDFDKRYSMYGSVFADFRCKFGADEPSRNIVIYGTSVPDSDVAFGGLNAYRDQQFAQEHPYLYFADEDKTMTWQVFAVSVLDIAVPYNDPDLTDDVFAEIVTLVQMASIHPFEEVTVTKEDRLLTLITADYTKTGSYPNNNRLVVMAKLVEQPAAQAPAAAPSEGAASPSKGIVFRNS